MEYFIIAALILLNGFFAMSEIALVSVRRAALVSEAQKGSKRAGIALRLLDQPDRFLSTIQIGITLIGILTGIYSGEVLSADFAAVLKSWGVPYSYTVAQSIIVVGVTYFTLIFGELVPKRLGLAFSGALAKSLAPVMNFLSKIGAPFVWILSKSTQLIFKILRLKDSRLKVTEDEIRTMVKEGAQGGEVREVEHDIVERVFSLGDRTVDSIMTHRSEIVWLDVDADLKSVKKFVSENVFKVYPAARGSLDNLQGLVSLKALIANWDSPDFSISKILEPAHYFHEDMDVYKALGEMRAHSLQCVLINDEFGSLQGIVTLKDILSALLGYATDNSAEPEIIARESGGWLVDGQCPFYDFLAHFDLEALYPENDYNTLSGLILEKLGRIPRSGERLVWENFRMEIADMDGARIDKVIVSKIDSEADE